jgi:hypothetical protein
MRLCFVFFFPLLAINPTKTSLEWSQFDDKMIWVGKKLTW